MGVKLTWFLEGNYCSRLAGIVAGRVREGRAELACARPGLKAELSSE